MRNIVFLIICMFSCTYSSPPHNNRNEKAAEQYNQLGQAEHSKPVWTNTVTKEKYDSRKISSPSRSWGASGMPFSVLYMRRSHNSSKRVRTTSVKPMKQEMKRSRNTKKVMLSLRIPYSIIPRVFPHIWRAKGGK